MNLREVREKAEQVFCEGADSWFAEPILLAEYILATIDPSPELPITADWLREEWGAVDGRMPGDLVIGPIVRGINKEIGKPYWMVRSWTITYDLTTRQQFCDLCRALGIPRRKERAK